VKQKLLLALVGGRAIDDELIASVFANAHNLNGSAASSASTT